MGFVSIATRPAFSFGEPSIRDTTGFGNTAPNSFPRRWDIAPDGKRIIGVAGTAVAAQGQLFADATQIQVVLNWFEELKQRMTAH
jgi:hypothetical protein